MSAFTTINLYQKDTEPLTFQKDEVIFEAGDKGEVMYALLEGEVGLWVKDQLVEVFSDGDVFGEGALVQLYHTRGSRAIAHTYCQLLTLDQNLTFPGKSSKAYWERAVEHQAKLKML